MQTCLTVCRTNSLAHQTVNNVRTAQEYAVDVSPILWISKQGVHVSEGTGLMRNRIDAKNARVNANIVCQHQNVPDVTIPIWMKITTVLPARCQTWINRRDARSVLQAILVGAKMYA